MQLKGVILLLLLFVCLFVCLCIVGRTCFDVVVLHISYRINLL